MRETLDFWRSFISDPRRMGAVAPSSDALAELITREISARDAPVIELGPGTGVFSRRLLERGIPESQLVLMEAGEALAAELARRFPTATVHHMDARRLSGIALPDGLRAGAIVSGLPLLAMPAPTVLRILRGAMSHLREDGALYQFTYGVRCPVPTAMLKRLGLRADCIGWVTVNLPPASVYRIRRDPEASPLTRTPSAVLQRV